MKSTVTLRSEGVFPTGSEHGLYKIAVGVAIVNGTDVLLTQRDFSRENNKGAWELVYGRSHKGENPFETAIREAKEEVGLDIEILHVVGIKHFLRTVLDSEYIGIIFIAHSVSRDVVPQKGEVMNWKWVPVQEAPLEVAEYEKDILVKMAEVMESVSQK